MFRGLKDKLGKSFNQTSSKLLARTLNDESPSNSSIQLAGQTQNNNEKRQDTVTPTNSLIDLNEDPPFLPDDNQLQHSTPISAIKEGTVTDHKSPAVLDLSNYESNEDLSKIHNETSMVATNQPTALPRKVSTDALGTGNRIRNDSMSSQMSDSYYFTSNSNFVPATTQHQLQQHQFHSLTSDAESVTSELDEPGSSPNNNFNATNKMLEFISKEELMKFYKKVQVKNQKYSGRYSQLFTAYKEIEKERDRLKEVLAKCQDKAFQRINELKEQISLKNMAMNDVEVNYTMMLQEKEEFIKVLQTQVNILKKKFDENKEKLINVDEDNYNWSNKPTDQNIKNEPQPQPTSSSAALSPVAIDYNEFVTMKEKYAKMTLLLGNCKATILKNREEIKELLEQNKILKENASSNLDVESVEAVFNSRIRELEMQLNSSTQNNIELMNNYQALQLDHDALNHKFIKTGDILNEDLKLLIMQKTNLESKYENLHEENLMLRKKIEIITKQLEAELNMKVENENRICYLEKLLKQHEASIAHWKDKIISSIECLSSKHEESCDEDDVNDDDTKSPPSTATVETAISNQTWPLNMRSNLDDDFKDILEKIEANLKNGSKKDLISNDSQTEECDDVDEETPVKECDEGDEKTQVNDDLTMQMIHDNKLLLKKLTSEKKELKKYLSRSQTQTKVFKHLYKNIFLMVTSKSQSGDAQEGNITSNNDDGIDNNVNNSIIHEQQKIKDDEEAMIATTSAIMTIPSNVTNEHHPNLVTSSCASDTSINDSSLSSAQQSESYEQERAHTTMYTHNQNNSNVQHTSTWSGYPGVRFEPPLTVRQSIIAILKDGLSRALIKMEEDKMKKHKKSAIPTLRSNQEVDGVNNGNNEFVSDGSSLVDINSCSYPSTVSSSFTSLGDSIVSQSKLSSETLVNTGDEDEWESVDEEHDEDDDQCDGDSALNVVHVDDSLKNLLESWKLSCEKLQRQEISSHQHLQHWGSNNDDVVDGSQNVEHIELTITKTRSKIDVFDNDIKERVNENDSTAGMLSNLRNEIDSLKNELSLSEEKFNTLFVDYNKLLNDHSLVKIDFENHKLNSDEVKVENINMLGMINALKQSSEMNEETKSCLQNNYDQLIHELDSISAEKQTLQTELVNMNDHYDQLQRNYNETSELLERTLNDYRKLELDMNVLNNVHNDLKDEHDKFNMQFNTLESNFNKVNDALLRLQQEHSHLSDDHKLLQVEVNDHKQNEMLLNDKFNELKFNYDKVLGENEKIKIENVELSKTHDETNVELGALKTSFDHLNQDYEKSVKAFEDLKSFNDNLNEINCNLLKSENDLKLKVSMLESLNNELIDKCENKNETGELLSNKIEECERIKNNLSKVEEDYDKLQIEMEMLRSSHKKSIDDFDALDDKYHKLLDERDLYFDKITKLEMDLSEQMNQVEKMELLKSELQMNIKNKEDELERLLSSKSEKENLEQKEISELKNLIAQKDSQIIQQNESVEELKKLLETMETEKINSLKEVDKYKSELKEMHHILETSSEKLSDKCKNFEHEISKLINDLMEVKGEKNELAIHNENIEKEKKEQMEEHCRLRQDLLNQLELVKLEVSEKSEVCESLKSSFDDEMRNHETNVDNLCCEINELKSNIETLEFDKNKELKEILLKRENDLSEAKNNFKTEIDILKSENENICKDVLSKNLIIEGFNKNLSDLENNLKKANLELENKDIQIKDQIKILDERKSLSDQLKNDNDQLISKLSSEIESLKKVVSEKEEEVVALNIKHNNEIDEFMKTEVSLNEKLEIFNQEKLKSNQELRDSYENKLTDIRNEIDDKNSQISKLVHEISEKDIMIGSLKIELDTKEVKLSCFELEFDNLKTELDRQNSKQNELLQEKSDGLEGYKLNIINLNKQLDDKSKTIESLQEEICNLKVNLNNKITDYQKLEETLKVSEHDWSDRNNELKKKAEIKLKQLKKQKTDADDLIYELTNSSTKSNEELTKLNNKLSTLNEQLIEKENNLTELNVKLLGEEQLKSQLSVQLLALEQETLDLKGELVSKNKELEDSKVCIKSLEQNIIEIKKDMTKKVEDNENYLKQLSEVTINLEKVKDVLNEKELDLLKRIEITSSLEGNLKTLEEKLQKNDHLLKMEIEEKLNLKKSLEKVDQESKIVVANNGAELADAKLELKQLKDHQSTVENEISTLKMEKNDLFKEIETIKIQNSEEMIKLHDKIQHLLYENEHLHEDNSHKLEINSLKEINDKLMSENNELKEMNKHFETIGDENKPCNEKFEKVEKELNDAITERDTLKKKVQSLQQEVKKLKSEIETNLKNFEEDKNKEIERLKQEYTDEMKERDDDNDMRMKQLLREFQLKMEDKEKQYQSNFTKSLEKFEDESQDKLNELHDEMHELKNDLRLKDEQMDEMSLQIDDLKQIMSHMHGEDEWRDLKERENELENEIQMLNQQLNHFHRQDDSSAVEDDVINKTVHYTESHHPALSSSSLTQIVPLEFEYLKTILYKYMTGTPDKQTLARVICKIMKYADNEEKEILRTNRR